MEFKNYKGRNFDKIIEEFWSKDYLKLRSIFSCNDDISPFPLLNIKDDNGLTAMNYAVCTNLDKHFKCLRTLIEISFVGLRDNFGRSLFHEICSNICCQDEKLVEKILQKLIDYGVSKCAKDNDGKVAYEGPSDFWAMKKRLERYRELEFSNKKFASQVMDEVRSKYLCIYKSLGTIPIALESLLVSASKTDIVKTIEEIPKETHKFFEVCGYDESIVENEPFYSEVKETTSRLLVYNYENLKSQDRESIITDIDSLFEPKTGLIATLSKTLYDMKLQSLNTTAKPRKAGNELVNTKQKAIKKASSKKGARDKRNKKAINKAIPDHTDFMHMEVDMPHSETKRPRDKSNDGSKNVINKKQKKIESVSSRSSSSSSRTDSTDNSRSVTKRTSSSPSKTNSMNQQALEKETIELSISKNICQIEKIQVGIDEICHKIEQLQANSCRDIVIQRILKLRRDKITKLEEQCKYKALNLELKRQLVLFPLD